MGSKPSRRRMSMAHGARPVQPLLEIRPARADINRRGPIMCPTRHSFRQFAPSLPRRALGRSGRRGR
eukprot:7061735-Pyramimonas_sp.AAC.1